jgi:N-acetylmuramoyl-L-alanine amidase
VQEKNITLAIALKLGKLIEDNCKDVNVIYTRTTDSFVELWERADIANRNSADVFISVHVNANPNKKITGTETYTMGLYKSEDNLEVAKRENSAVLLENNYADNYEGFDPKSPEGNIIFQLYQNNYCAQSIRLAGKI